MKWAWMEFAPSTHNARYKVNPNAFLLFYNALKGWVTHCHALLRKFAFIEIDSFIEKNCYNLKRVTNCSKNGFLIIFFKIIIIITWRDLYCGPILNYRLAEPKTGAQISKIIIWFLITWLEILNDPIGKKIQNFHKSR